MLTALLLAAILAADPTPPETMVALARAERDVITARAVQDACWTPRECLVARQLVDAAEDAVSAARTLAGPAAVEREDDPFAGDASPFVDDWPPFAGTPLPSESEVEQMIAEGNALTEAR